MAIGQNIKYVIVIGYITYVISCRIMEHPGGIQEYRMRFISISVDGRAGAGVILNLTELSHSKIVYLRGDIFGTLSS